MNHQSKLKQKSQGRGNFSRFLKGISVFIAASVLVIGGFFVVNNHAFASGSVVTPATGGTNVSLDTSSAAGGSPVYTTISGLTITESAPGEIGTGVYTLTLPAGWKFATEIGSYEDITLSVTPGTGLGVFFTGLVPSFNTVTVWVTATSTSGPGTLTFGPMKVRPTTTTPSSGNITLSTGFGALIAGVDGTTNFGTLSSVPGAATKLAFTTQPGATTPLGSNLSTQPVVKTQDQFGNNSSAGLGVSHNVTLSLTSGTGFLLGTATSDVGTGAGNGTAAYFGLQVDAVGTGKQLTVAGASLTSTTSSLFEITAAPPVIPVAPIITWSNPADIIVGTPLSATQLNATTSTSGSFVYTPASGTVLGVGASQTLTSVFTPTDTVVYTPATTTVTINVLPVGPVIPATPVITWANPADITVGTSLSATQLNASTPTPGSFVYTPASGTLLAVGPGQTLTSVFTPTDTVNFTPATTTVTINVIPVSSSGGGGSSSSGGGGGQSQGGDRSRIFTLPTQSPTPSVQGSVLGAQNFRFLIDLRRGMNNNDVVELQKRLRAEGFFTYPTDTGYFGPFTLAAVKAYQTAHGIPYITGFVGPLTRAELNK